MAEIAFVTVGRALQVQTDAKNLRRQEERARQELDLTRQAQVAQQVRTAGDLEQARRNRTQTVVDEQRTRLADQKLFDAQRESQEVRASDERFDNLQAEISEEILRARALEDDTGPLPPLPPGELTGIVLTPGDIEARDRLNSFSEPIPAPPPDDDRQFAQGPAPLETGVAGVQPPDDGFEGAEAQAVTDALAFNLLEGERTVRLADRRDDDRDLQSQQQVNQRTAENRIVQIPFDPNLPRGSIVDISG